MTPMQSPAQLRDAGFATPLGRLTDAALEILRRDGDQAVVTEVELRASGVSELELRRHGAKAIAQARELYGKRQSSEAAAAAKEE